MWDASNVQMTKITTRARRRAPTDCRSQRTSIAASWPIRSLPPSRSTSSNTSSSTAASTPTERMHATTNLFLMCSRLFGGTHANELAGYCCVHCRARRQPRLKVGHAANVQREVAVTDEPDDLVRHLLPVG